jgi:cell division protein FtsB
MKFSIKNDIEPMIRKFEELLGLSFKVFLITSIIVTVLGIYVANLLFGKHSLQVLQGLKNEEQTLQKEIKELKKENAQLHKQYLEWSDAKK